MARKSAAALAVVTNLPGQRLEPPESLTPSQAEIWRKIVSSEPAEFFRTAACQDLLVNYCRHADTADQLTVKINETEDMDSEAGLRRFEILVRSRDRESRAAVTMATKLRLTNQSRYETKVANTASKKVVNRPWDE